MHQSHVITIDGVFVGAAIRSDRGYRFVAPGKSLNGLEQAIWATLADVERLARSLYWTGCLGCFCAHAHGDPAAQVGG